MSKNLWTPVKNENDFKQQITKSVDYTISEIVFFSDICQLLSFSQKEVLHSARFAADTTRTSICTTSETVDCSSTVTESILKMWRNRLTKRSVWRSFCVWCPLEPSWYIVYASDQQLHGFNFPAQLGKQGDHVCFLFFYFIHSRTLERSRSWISKRTTSSWWAPTASLTICSTTSLQV